MSFRTKPWWFLCLLINPGKTYWIQADDTAVLCDDVNHEKAIHVRTWVGRNLGLQVPPKKKTMRYPHLEHPLSHGRVDLKEIIQSSLPVAMASQNDFRDPPFWTIRQWPFLLGTPEKNAPKRGEISKIHQIFVGFSPMQCPKWKVGLRASAGAVHLGFLASPWPTCVCRIPPLHRWKSWIFFSWKLFKTRLEMGSNRRSCDLFSKEIMQFCTGEGCPLPNTLVGTMLRFDFEMQTSNFHTARMEGASQKESNCQLESPLDFHSHSAAFSFTTLNLCSLRRPRAPQS